MKFTYKTEKNEDVLYTLIEQTGGLFYGYTAEQVAAVAENIQPNYQSHNMSEVFSSIYFNYCVRKVLQGESVPNMHIPAFLKKD
jgi:hypothetical protein